MNYSNALMVWGSDEIEKVVRDEPRKRLPSLETKNVSISGGHLPRTGDLDEAAAVSDADAALLMI